jgi:hypothetical protein
VSAPVRSSRNISAGIVPDAGATSALPAWWGADDWLAEVADALTPDVCTEFHVAPDTALKVAQTMAAYADHRTGRDCRPTNARLVEVAQLSLSTVQRARRVLRHLGFVVELVRGRSIMTRSERLQAWRRGSAHRQVASVFALCSRPRRAPKRATTGLERGARFIGADLQTVDGDTPPGADKVSTSLQSRSGHLRRRTETRNGAPRRAATGKGLEREAGGFDPRTRRLAESVRGRLGWLRGVSGRRLAPTLHRFALAGWTARDVDDAVRDALGARGWRLPARLQQPAAYLATLLRSADPADRPGAAREHMRRVEAAEDAYRLRLATGAPCPHGRPAGDEPSPLRGLLACPACRRGAEPAGW